MGTTYSKAPMPMQDTTGARSCTCIVVHRNYELVVLVHKEDQDNVIEGTEMDEETSACTTQPLQAAPVIASSSNIAEESTEECNVALAD